MNISKFIRYFSPAVYVAFWLWFFYLLIFHDLSNEEIAAWIVFNTVPWGTIAAWCSSYIMAFFGL